MAGGFRAISLWGRDYWAARREGLSDGDIRIALADAGLTVAEIDPAWWWLPGASEVRIPPDLDTEDVFQYRAEELFRIADVVGARSLNAVDVFGGEWAVDAAAECFASLCDAAKEHGLLVHIEFLPWSRIPDLASAWEIVRRADRPNGGVAVDSWHWFRGGADVELLTAIPGDRILGVQISDGPKKPEDDLLSATLHNRQVPGEGEFDLQTLVNRLAGAGAQAPVGVEVFSDELHNLPPVEIGKRVADATRQLLAG